MPLDAVSSPQANPHGGGRLGRLLVGGAFWAVFGFGTAQLLRLVSNLILTRLLFPDAFGIMALVTVIMQGIAMLSDAGLRGSVIYHQDGDSVEFLDTVWTIQVIRGFLLWLAAALLAYPFAYFYEEPWLAAILPVSGFVAVIQGFTPTKMLSANRHLNVRWLILLELTSTAIGLTVAVVLSWLTRSIWSLVIGTMVTALVTLINAQLREGHRNRFCWNREVAGEVTRFGRWIFISSACSYVFNSGDRLVLGHFFTAAELGVYSVAAMMARLPVAVIESLRARVMQPLYARSWREESTEKVRQRIARTRMALLALILPYSCLLFIFGQEVIDLLYDPRYAAAGWMTSILSLGAVIQICSDIGPVFQARGDSINHFRIVVIRSVSFTVCVAIGGIWGGATGVILAIPISALAPYPLTAIVYYRNHVWSPAVDFAGFGFFGAFTAFAYGLYVLLV